MAEIKVNLKADDSDVKAKFRDAGAAAREFRDHIKEQFGEIKETAADIAGESGFGGIKNILTGLGAVTFGAAIVEQFKKAIEAGIEWEKQVNSLKFSLPAAFADMSESIAEWVESVSGGMGNFEDNLKVMQALFHSGMGVEEAKAALIDLQNAAVKLNIPVGELGEAFARIKETGRVPERLFEEMPALAPIARGLGGAEHPSANWMLRTLLPNIAPGGMNAPVRVQTEATASAQLAKFAVDLEDVSKTLGVELLPTLKEWLKTFHDSIPEIAKDAKLLGEDLAKAFEWIHKNLGWLGSDIAADRYPGQRTIESTSNKLWGEHGNVFTKVAELMQNAAEYLKMNAETNATTAERLGRAVNPY